LKASPRKNSSASVHSHSLHRHNLSCK
jgi:hypothetical protein